MPSLGALYKSDGAQVSAAEYDIAQEDAMMTVTRADNGAVPLVARDTLTGGQEVASYRADVNLDGAFDVNDVLPVGVKVYCLISPESFSCGNLVPAIFKDSPRITLIGRDSGGGTCVVQPCTAANGATFQISGPCQLSTIRNGSFYDIDRGIAPDFGIDKVETFYDREQLVEFIHSLK